MTRVLTTCQSFPFAGFVVLSRRQTCSECFKAIFHLASPFPFSKFMSDSQFRGSAVRRGSICCLCFAHQVSNLSVLERMVVDVLW